MAHPVNRPLAGIRIVIFLSTIASLVLFASPFPREVSKQPADYFPTRVGSKWVYRNTQNAEWERTDIITSVEEKQGFRISIGTKLDDDTIGHRENMHLSPDGLFKVDLDDDGKELLTRYLKFPIRTPEVWDCLIRGTTGTATCDGIERIEVPAGSFDAVKILVRYKTNNIGGGKVAAWFALGVGPVKFQFGDGDAAEVLHSFTLGPNTK